MKQNLLAKKEEMALQIGMQFDEAVELFSEETLELMVLGSIIGGDPTNNGCNVVAGCGCEQMYCSISACQTFTCGSTRPF